MAVSENENSLLKAVAKEQGISPEMLISQVLVERQRIHKMLYNTQGKCRVLGVDKYDEIDWIEAEFEDYESAQKFASNKNNQRMSNMYSMTFNSDGSVLKEQQSSVIYYAYTSEGLGLGPLTEH